MSSSEEDDDYEYVSGGEGSSDGDSDHQGETKTTSLRQSTFQTLRQVSYDVIDEDKLDAKKKMLVDEVSSVLSITQCEASLMLLAYKWNKDLVISEWFVDKVKCCGKAGLVDESLGKAMPLDKCPCVLCGALPPPPTTQPTTAATTSKSTAHKPTTKKSKPKRKTKPGKDAIARQLKTMKKKGMKFSFPKGHHDVFHLQFPIACRGMWTGITHTFDVALPTDYPFSPPTAVECNEYQGTLHPNIDPSSGNVCINTLRESWSPSMTLQDICWTLAQLFAEPGWDHSLNPKANALFKGSTGSPANKMSFFTNLKKQGAKNPESYENADVLLMATNDAAVGGTDTAQETKQNHTGTGTPACDTTECLGCNHYVCNDCWTTYLGSRVTTDMLGCVFAKCPFSGCNVIVPEAMFRKHCNEMTFKKYERHVLASYMADSSFAKYCAGKGCNRVIEYPDGCKNRVIECVCGHEFCFTCEHEHGHLPLQCPMLDRWEEERATFKGLSTDDLWFAQNVKKCPKRHGGCDRMIEKNEGCMHMTCRKGKGGCGFEFCWLCLGPWSTHGSATGGYYACNNYEKAGKAGTLTGEAKAAYDAASLKITHAQKLKFYEFYVQRHVFMKNSADGARARDLTEIKNKMELCLALDGDVQRRHRERTAILLRANKMVEKCRRVLQWVYVAAYYFPRDSALYPLFKSNHDSLEGHTEHLNRIVSFGSQTNGQETSWENIIQQEGSSVVADVLRELEAETTRVENFLNSFMKSDEFDLYFREGLRDTNSLPPDARS